MTNNYSEYLGKNLSQICRTIELKDLNQSQLTQFLLVVRTSLQMEDQTLGELILQTVVYSQHFEAIFPVFALNHEGQAEVPISKARKLTIDLQFCIAEERELRYLVELVNVASMLI